jgi:photosystem II stability/assembly factor-like uncharacterized protein
MNHQRTSVPPLGRPWQAVLTTVTAALLLLGLLAPAPAIADSGWQLLPRPWASRWQVTDITAFGPSGLAAVGDGGHIGVSQDGGATWMVTVPSGHKATVFGAVAFNSAGAGVVASGGLLLVTADGGQSWHAPVFVGAGPGKQVRDVAMTGKVALAVGDDGVIVSSADSGTTWHRLASPTSADLVAVAAAGDGTGVAGASSGEVLTGTGDTWVMAGDAGEGVTAAAAAPDPTWGDGRPDLLVATASGVLGSDDGLAFTSVPIPPPPIYAAPWHDLAWVGRPGRSLLVGGGGGAGGFYSTSSADWLLTQTGFAGSVCAAAPGTQSVAYILGPDGSIARTLSSGREPAVTRLSAKRVTIGRRVRFTAVLNLAAPGRAQLERRVPGQAWRPAAGATWTTSYWQKSLTLDLIPTLTQEFRVRFAYGGAKTTLAPVRRLVVAPRLTPKRLRYELHVGGVYRFSGSVYPRLSGERVGLYTDRGGRWRPVTGQESVSLRDGRLWTSRSFGSPKAETYHLKAHIAKTARHGAAWSRVVTVVIR